MAVMRENPYAGFNFLVDLGDGNTEGAQAGFSEVGGLGMEIQVIEYRNGNARENSVLKLPGLHKAGDVTLKRGVIGSLSLWNWIDDVRNGNVQARRNVIIHLQNEDHSMVVESWKLLRAWPSKYVGPRLNARSTDIAIEELVLSCDRMEQE